MKFEILPTEYCPTKIEEFCGPAKIVAGRIQKSADMCLPRGAPASHLFVGPSGSGKTALARFALTVFGCHKWNVTEYFGADLDIEAAREISFKMRLSSLYDGFKGIFLDEIDGCSREARARILEYVGESKQPRKTVIVATSNLSLDEFDALEKTADARGRLGSRFQAHQVTGPSSEEIKPLLQIWLPKDQAHNIAVMGATGPSGKANQPINVRSALKDCLTMMQA